MSYQRLRLCMHVHLYQPPRSGPVMAAAKGDPLLSEYESWNARMTENAYRPNAREGNFSRVSFDVTETLFRWMAQHAPDVYETIVAADKSYADAHGGNGNALAGTMHHVILPLCKERDKRTQLLWGREAFRHRFGRDPIGLWLPEMAVDLETLAIARQLGYEFTILSQAQIAGGGNGSGPYRLDLPGGDSIGVYVRNDDLSNRLSFSLSTLGGAGHWTRYELAGQRKAGRLVLLAVDAATFGYYHPGEEKFLSWLMQYEAQAVGFDPVTLNIDFAQNPPRRAIEIQEYTCWTHPHGLNRFVSGDSAGTSWRGVLRRAMDRLAAELDYIYADVCRTQSVDPWALRDEYIDVILKRSSLSEFFAEHDLTEDMLAELGALLEAQKLAQQMFVSTPFYSPDFSTPEIHYVLASAAYISELVRHAAGHDLGGRFRADLGIIQGKPDGDAVYENITRVIEDGFERALEDAPGSPT